MAERSRGPSSALPTWPGRCRASCIAERTPARHRVCARSCAASRPAGWPLSDCGAGPSGCTMFVTSQHATLFTCSGRAVSPHHGLLPGSRAWQLRRQCRHLHLGNTDHLNAKGTAYMGVRLPMAVVKYNDECPSPDWYRVL